MTGWAALFVSALVLGDHVAYTSDGPAVETVRIAVTVGVVGVLVVALGAIVRHAVGTLATAFALLAGTLALPERVAAWTPAGAAARFVSANALEYPTAVGLPIVAGWAAVLYGVGAYLLQRRDA